MQNSTDKSKKILMMTEVMSMEQSRMFNRAYRIFKSVFQVISCLCFSLLFAYILLIATTRPALAEVYWLIPEDKCGIVVASEQSLPLLMASPNFVPYSNSNVWVLKMRKGAFAAIIGITDKQGREGILGELLENGVINEDAFCSGGDKFEMLATEPPDAEIPSFGGMVEQEIMSQENETLTVAPRLVSSEEILAAQPILEGTLRDMIPQVKRLQTVYADYATMMDGGSAGNTNGLDRATPYLCANISRFQGQSDHLGEGGAFVYLEAGDAPFQFVFEVAALDVWLYSAQKVLDMDGRQMLGVWNLECVGNFGIPASAYISVDTPQAGLTAKDDKLSVLGEIDVGFFDRFYATLELHPEVTTISLGSGGGSVIDALQAGEIIRMRGLNTELYGKCFSACPMIFAAGVRRTIYWPAGGSLGFHQIYTDDGTLALTDPIYQILNAYLVRMGVDADAFIGMMTLAGPSEIHEPDVGSLCLPRIATWVQRQCQAN